MKLRLLAIRFARLAIAGLALATTLVFAPAQAVPGAAVEHDSISATTSNLRVHFIDVGGGFAALIETPGGKHILVDGGKKGTSDYLEYVEHFVGDNQIDILIVTHADDSPRRPGI